MPHVPLVLPSLLALALLSGCTSAPSVDLQSSTAATASEETPGSWAAADLLELATDAGSSATETTETTALDSDAAAGLLGREGDTTQVPQEGAVVTSIKARISGGYYDGRVVWVVGVYPVELPAKMAGISTSTAEPSGRAASVFDANSGEHLGTTIVAGPPPWE